jgi:tetratricopeptide (TPR) repeat protein
VLKPPAGDGPVEVLSRQDIETRAAKDQQDFLAQLAMGEALYKEDKFDQAVEYLERSRTLFPEYGGKGNPYWYLAQIRKQQGQLEKAAEELGGLTRINESHYRAHVELGEIRETLGDPSAAAESLERAIYIYPFEMSLHKRLADLYAQLGQWEASIRERGAVVALERVDRAQAIYELAAAHYQAGDLPAARREVLRALEIAPNFDEALELLLRLQPGTAKNRDKR